MKPVFTIITVCFNAAATIGESIESLKRQSFKDFEYIVIDALSTDGTIEILESYSTFIDLLISEPDAGIYNAMNKGVSLAKGQYVGFLNADDQYLPQTLEIVNEKLKCCHNPAYTLGIVNLIDQNGLVVAESGFVERSVRARRLGREMPACHLSIFMSREAWTVHGGFDESLPLRADLDLILRARKSRFIEIEIPEILGNFRIDGRSSSIAKHKDTFWILRKHHQSIALALFWTATLILKFYMVKLVKVMPFVVRTKIERLRFHSRHAMIKDEFK